MSYQIDDTIRAINTLMLVLVVVPSFVIACRAFTSHSTLKSIRYILAYAFVCFSISAMLSIIINILVSLHASMHDTTSLANVRNLIKNSGLLVLVYGLYSVHQGGDTHDKGN